MRVCIVSPYDPRPPSGGDPRGIVGGVEAALDRSAAGLAARGHEVTLVCSAARAGRVRDADGVEVVRVRRHGALFRAPLAPLWRHVPADAEVVHVPATYPLVSDLIPWRDASRRAVVLDHHFDVRGTSPAMRLAVAAHRASLGRLMLRATRIVVRSLDHARHSRVLAGVPSTRLDWVPNGVDPDAFPLSTERGPDVLCVGRLVPYKGVDVLLRAMGRVHRETGAFLTIVGDGPERPRLEALARRLGAPATFLGRVDAARLASLYGSHRLSVLPSVNGQEAFGIALLESLSTGTPVVASALPGVREIARLGGEVVPPRDPDALAEAIVRLWHAPQRRGTPTQLRARVVGTFAWPRVLDRLEGAYTRALASRGARG